MIRALHVKKQTILWLSINYPGVMSGPSVNSNLFGLKQNFLDMGMCQKKCDPCQSKKFLFGPKKFGPEKKSGVFHS